MNRIIRKNKSLFRSVAYQFHVRITIAIFFQTSKNQLDWFLFMFSLLCVKHTFVCLHYSISWQMYTNEKNTCKYLKHTLLCFHAITYRTTFLSTERGEIGPEISTPTEPRIAANREYILNQIVTPGIAIELNRELLIYSQLLLSVWYRIRQQTHKHGCNCEKIYAVYWWWWGPTNYMSSCTEWHNGMSFQHNIRHENPAWGLYLVFTIVAAQDFVL